MPGAVRASARNVTGMVVGCSALLGAFRSVQGAIVVIRVLKNALFPPIGDE